MQRLTTWTTLVVVALLFLAGVFLPPAGAVLAQSVQDDEIILVEGDGRIRVVDPYQGPGIRPAEWDSGSELGWTRVAAGDLNGDGDAEIVAAQANRLKVFDPPIGQSSAPTVSFEVTLASNETVRLIEVADFDGDGRDEIAITHAGSGVNIAETLKVYDGGTSGQSNEWRLWYTEAFGASWISMSAGDINADAAADLVLVRQPDNLLKAYNGRNWAQLYQAGLPTYGFDWLEVAVGNVSEVSDTWLGDELILSRETSAGTNQFNTELWFRYDRANSRMVDWSPAAPANYHYPYFTSIELGDLDGSGDQEVIMLRDPRTAGGVSLLVVNPAGANLPYTLQVRDGSGGSAWRQVRAGDLDADGRDEIVILRGSGYRYYTEPELGEANQEVFGSYRVDSFAVADVDGAGQPVGPVLDLTPQELAFDLEYGATATQYVNVSNVGNDATLTWVAQKVLGGNWLQFDPATSSTPGRIRVTVDSVAAGPGTHTGTLRVLATDGADFSSIQDLSITMEVDDPGFVVRPSDVLLMLEPGQTASRPIYMLYSGTGSVTWTATAMEVASLSDLESYVEAVSEGLVPDAEAQQAPTWLQLNPAAGTTSPTQPGMTITADATGLTPGTYRAVVTVAAPDAVRNPVRTVSVTLVVAENVRTLRLPVVFN